VDQTSATTTQAPPVQAPQGGQPADPGTAAAPPGFRTRGRARRRARFLRKARELAYRDLGGLVFNLHRFGQRNDSLVFAKLSTLGQIDAELRSLESALREHQPVTVLREAGITACPRCAAIHSGEDRFCPNCGLSVSRHADLPIAGASGPAAPAAGAPPAAAPTAPTVAHTPQPPPASGAAPTTPAGAGTPAPVPGRPAPGAPATPSGAAPARGSAPPSATPPASAAPPPSTSSSPVPATPPSPAQGSSADDEPTRILRPPAAGA
jgi:hypothetical protein